MRITDRWSLLLGFRVTCRVLFVDVDGVSDAHLWRVRVGVMGKKSRYHEFPHYVHFYYFALCRGGHDKMKKSLANERVSCGILRCGFDSVSLELNSSANYASNMINGCQAPGL